MDRYTNGWMDRQIQQNPIYMYMYIHTCTCTTYYYDMTYYYDRLLYIHVHVPGSLVLYSLLLKSYYELSKHYIVVLTQHVLYEVHQVQI